MKEQLFVVWQETPTGWIAQEAQSLRYAGVEAALIQRSGFQVRIEPRHSVTVADICDH